MSLHIITCYYITNNSNTTQCFFQMSFYEQSTEICHSNHDSNTDHPEEHSDIQESNKDGELFEINRLGSGTEAHEDHVSSDSMDKEAEESKEIGRLTRRDHTTSTTSQTMSGITTSKEYTCLLYTSPSPRDLSTSRMPSSA